MSLIALALSACSDSTPREADGAAPARSDAGEARDGSPAVRDAEQVPPTGAKRDSGPPDAPYVMTSLPSPFDGELTPLRRGEYLVRHVLGCVECHAPRNQDGSFDEDRLLSGAENIVDLAPTDDTAGAIHAPNLTPHPETGIGLWTDDEIKNAITNGIGSDNHVIHPTMPYWLYHNLPDEEVDHILLYLRSIPAVDRMIAHHQPLPEPLVGPAAPVPTEAIPDTTLGPDDPDYDRAQRGKYLAQFFCLYCHSPPSAPGSAVPVDIDRLFTGDRFFPPFPLNAVPEGAPEIESKNLTPHATGIDDASPEQIRRAIKIGQNALGVAVCPPMPAGRFASFGLMTDRDALDIGHYLTTLPPRETGPTDECCVACHGENGEVTEPGLNPLSVDLDRLLSIESLYHDGTSGCASLRTRGLR